MAQALFAVADVLKCIHIHFLGHSVEATHNNSATRQAMYVQGDSVARGPKLLSIKNYVIEIMIWKFINKGIFVYYTSSLTQLNYLFY